MLQPFNMAFVTVPESGVPATHHNPSVIHTGHTGKCSLYFLVYQCYSNLIMILLQDMCQ